MNKTYTFIAMCDGEKMGGMKGVSFEELSEVVACTFDSIDVDECWHCADIKRFLTSLEEDGQAMMVVYEPEGESVAIAYYEAQQRPF